MIIIYSINNIPIRLTGERWEHIIKRHPEIKQEKEKLLRTIKEPKYILEGDFGELIAVKFFEETPFGPKFFVVIYKEIEKTDGFIITAYFSDKLSERRRILWKQ